jgi:hypothetical protein
MYILLLSMKIKVFQLNIVFSIYIQYMYDVLLLHMIITLIIKHEDMSKNSSVYFFPPNSKTLLCSCFMNILYLFQNVLGYTIVTMFLTVNLNKFRISYFTHTVPELTLFFFLKLHVVFNHN